MLHESDNDINLSTTENDVLAHLDGLEGRLLQLQHQVEQLQRLASLGTMTAMLAHEFNNALTPILSYCQYALQRGEPELMRTAVEKSLKNAQRLGHLCERVLGMATDDQMGPTDTVILPLIQDAVECLGRDLDKDNIELSLDVPEDLSARATAGSLQQVLFNIVINARQAMLGPGGRMRMAARRTEDGRVSITITDTGQGIKPELLDKIFEPFYTTKQHESRADQHGIGLGLHICRQLMEEQDGTIEVTSKPGQGATFTLTLPGTA